MCYLADSFGRTGSQLRCDENRAWSVHAAVSPLVPLRQVFTTLHQTFGEARHAREEPDAASSIREVEDTLQLMQLHALQVERHHTIDVEQLHQASDLPAPSVGEQPAHVVLAPAAPSVYDLFTNPASALLRQQSERRQRTTQSLNMTKVRQSARLAKKLVIPALKRAQRNLWHKLGVSNDELRPIENILQDFISSHQAPLSEHIIATMTVLFDLDDEGAKLVNDALFQHASQYIDGVCNELTAFQE